MASIIQIRRDIAANWTSTNPTLAEGELGIETNTALLKLGDGTTAWNSLAYFSLGGSVVKENLITVAKAGGDHDTIQAAINASTSNDVIMVYPGIYTEAITAKAGSTTTIEGIGVMGSIVVQQDTGTVVTIPSTAAMLTKNIKLKSVATGLNASKLVDMQGIVGLFTKTYFDYDVNNGSNSAAINFATGSIILTDCKYDFTSTGTSGAVNNFITTAGTAQVQFVRGYAKMSIEAITAAEHLHFLDNNSTSNDTVHYIDFRLSAAANFAGDIDLIHSSAGGEVEVQSCKIKITTTGAAAGSYAQVYHLAGTSGCHVHSTGNRVEVTGFEGNYLGNVGATETLYSHFDDIVADGNVIGAGAYSYVNSPSDGDLQMSGDIIQKVVSMTVDHPATADWEFGILDATPSTGDLTATVDTSVFGTLPSGAQKMFINSGTAHNLIIDPNGATIDGSTNDRVIYPGGYIIVEKVGSQSVIISSRNTSFNIELADIANKSFHVDFSNASSVTVDGSNHITNVVDSVNSWNGTPSSATGVAYGGTTQNGLNTAKWDTSNTPLSFGDNDIHDNAAGRGMTIMAIVRPDSANDAIMSKYFDGTPQREWRLYTSASVIYSNLDASGAEAIMNYSSNYDEWQVVQLEWTPSAGSKMYKNGFLLGSSANAVATIPAGTANLLMGASDATSADYRGEIGEIIAFSDTLSNDEREALTSKLGAKWGIDIAVFSASDSSPFGRNSDTNTIKPLIDGDNIETSGYITGKPCGVFAFLTAPADTTCTVADTYYPIGGTFTNAPIEEFGAATTYTPGIKYTGTKTQYFEIDWHGTLSGDSSSTTVHVGIKKNGTLVTGSEIEQFLKNDDQPYAISGTFVVELAEDDEIQLVVQADGAGDVITFNHFTTSISEFFD